MIIFRACALGDFVVSVPLLRALGDPLLVARGEHLALARAGGLQVEGVDADRAGVHPLYTNGPEEGRIAPALRERLSRGESALVLSRPGEVRALLSGNLERLGAQRVLVVDPYPPPGVHAVDHLLGAAPDRGAERVPQLHVARAAGESRLHSAGLDPDRPIVALHPGSGAAAKCWPAERWLEVTRGLDAQLVVVEGPADAEPAARFLAGRPAPRLRALGLVELAEALARCDALLGHDSGVSHLAAALGVPVLALFGPSDPLRWAPRGPSVRVLTAPGGSRDLRDLGVSEVCAAARALLQSTTSR